MTSRWRATNTNGTLDASFGSGGKVTTAIGVYGNYAVSLALRPDGKIVVGGETDDALPNAYFALVQYNADGTLDTAFGSGGTVTGPAGLPYEMVRQHDGKLLMAGGYTDATENVNYTQLVRFNADGSLDASFGTNGVARFAGDDAAGLLLQTDGRAVLAGTDGVQVQLARVLTSYCGPQAADLTCKASASNKLMIKQGATDAADHVLFKWKKGNATNTGELADPTTTSEYSLCVYDDGGLRMQMTALAGGTCNGQACWATKTKGYNYLDKTAGTDGIKKIKLQAGAVGKAQAQFTGQGDALPDLNPAQPFNGTVAAELVNEETGTCFVAEYPPATVQQNDNFAFKAKQ